MNRPRVYADFHNLDDTNRLRLTCQGTKDDLRRLGLPLREGLLLTFDLDDADDQGRPDALLVDGEVKYHQAEQCWVAQVDWSTVRHASDDRSQSGHGVAVDVSSVAHPEQPTSKH